jgi:hypothetical protein
MDITEGTPLRDASSLRGGSSFGSDCGGAWDCGRELRNLRDAVTRSRTEEGSALRRNAEELERCALRRQHDESTALQHFLQGLHEAFEAKLERQRAHNSGRIDALERRLDGEADRLASFRSEVGAEARLAVKESFEKISESEGFVQAVQGLLEKVSTEIQESAVSAARAVAEELVEEIRIGMDGDLAKCVTTVEEHATAMNVSTDELKGRLRQLVDTVADHGQSLMDLFAKGRHGVSRLNEFDASLHKLEGNVDTLFCSKAASEKFAEGLEASEEFAQNMVRRVHEELDAAKQSLYCEIEDSELSAREEVAKAICDFHNANSEVQCWLDESHADFDQQAVLAARNMETVEDEVTAAVGRSEAAASALDAQLRKGLEDMLGRHSQEHAEQFDSMERCLERRSQEHQEHLDNLHRAVSSVREMECCETRSLQHLYEECQSWAPEFKRLGKQIVENRHELASASSQWRTSAADNAQTLGALTTSCERVSKDLQQFQQQGLSHEWRLAKCMQRLEYLAMTEDSGVWLDSPEFTLGPLGQVELRLYPSGLRGGSGQCAAGLHSRAASGLCAAPMQLDVSVQGLRRRAAAKRDEDGGMLWLVQDLGKLETHLAQTEDLLISVEIPPRPWVGVDGSAAAAPLDTTRLISRPPPFTAEPVKERSIADAISESNSGTSGRQSRPSSAGRIGRPSVGPTGAPPKAAPAFGISAHSNGYDEMARGFDRAVATVGRLPFGTPTGQPQPPSSGNPSGPAISSSPLGSPLTSAASPGRPGWTVFGPESREAADLRLTGTSEPSGVVPAAGKFDSTSSSWSCSAGQSVPRTPASPLNKEARLVSGPISLPRGSIGERQPASNNPFIDK